MILIILFILSLLAIFLDVRRHGEGWGLFGGTILFFVAGLGMLVAGLAGESSRVDLLAYHESRAGQLSVYVDATDRYNTTLASHLTWGDTALCGCFYPDVSDLDFIEKE